MPGPRALPLGYYVARLWRWIVAGDFYAVDASWWGWDVGRVRGKARGGARGEYIYFSVDLGADGF